MDELLYEVRGRVGIVTLNRPDRLNALSDEMHAGLPELWQQIRGDQELGAVIVTGTGRGFCVGMDLKRVGERGGFREHTSNKIAEIQKLTALQNDVWLPTIVAVNGVCAGGGLHFVADADIVIASSDATFVDPHVSVGQASVYETIALAKKSPMESVLRMAFVGRYERLSAARAYALGICSQVVDPPARLRDEAQALGELIARNSPAALAHTKRALWGALERVSR
jgi:enoyl-CoA hydratase